MIEIEVNPRRVANLLKQIINMHCVEGEEWFKDIDNPSASLFDLSEAILILEDVEPFTIRVKENNAGTKERS